MSPQTALLEKGKRPIELRAGARPQRGGNWFVKDMTKDATEPNGKLGDQKKKVARAGEGTQCATKMNRDLSIRKGRADKARLCKREITVVGKNLNLLHKGRQKSANQSDSNNNTGS